jgi:predicted lipoprotein with Yx(FWY)xxD motif
MRKNGWAAAVGLTGAALLLTACGGSSASSSAPAAGQTAQHSAQAAAGQPSSAALGGIQPGSIVLMVQKSDLGYVLAEANGQVVYTYAKDSKGASPACTGSCASSWKPVTGKPLPSMASTRLGTLGTVSDASGAKQVTYNGLPLYTYSGAKALTTAGQGVGGVWHVVKLSQSTSRAADLGP